MTLQQALSNPLRGILIRMAAVNAALDLEAIYTASFVQADPGDPTILKVFQASTPEAAFAGLIRQIEYMESDNSKLSEGMTQSTK